VRFFPLHLVLFVARKPHERRFDAHNVGRLPNEGLCPRCHDIIEWKKKYRKYKPLTTPKRWYVLPCRLAASRR
jgi:hypothetical protein